MFIQMMKRKDGYPVRSYKRPDQWRVALKSHRNTNTELKSSSWCWERENNWFLYFIFFFPIFLSECFSIKKYFYGCTIFLFLLVKFSLKIERIFFFMTKQDFSHAHTQNFFNKIKKCVVDFSILIFLLLDHLRLNFTPFNFVNK